MLLGAGSAMAGTTYSMTWHHSVYKVGSSTGGFSSVSCAAVNLCVAVDGAGDVVWSTSPMRATAASWRIAAIDASGGGLTGISCPSKNLCVAVDANGELTYSTIPNGGQKDWSTPVQIDSVAATAGSYVGLAGISCPTTKLCVAVDNSPNGGVLVSTNPTGGASTWRRARLGTGAQLTSVSCPSSKLCVVSGAKTYYSTNPRGYKSYWTQSQSAPSDGTFAAVGCAHATKTCLAVGYGSSSIGFSYGTSNAASTTSWTASKVLSSDPPTSTEGMLDAVACPAGNFCVALDSTDDVATTSTPVRGRWSALSTLPSFATTISTTYANATALSCTLKICVAVDSNGYVTGGAVNAKTTSSGASKKSTATSSKKSTTKTSAKTSTK